ncbi:hypothetical protein H072_8509 [Dactylellina haptotyla CBS 200.50]|uniref:Uncharacterized protein n=1 Tax=Dactylellina haptotyla (strain CBS 200.50) TaxID=1284197 RepID=S8A472_DACHA|nr:hypothetical protein H072_8509 [Dactylellina haptotyla CBS 200.50]
MTTAQGVPLQTLASSTSPFAHLTDNNKQGLCSVLWGWTFCENCKHFKLCTDSECPGTRVHSLRQYFHHYKRLVSAYSHDLQYFEEDKSLNSHEEILIIIERIKEKPNITRRKLAEAVFGTEPAGAATKTDREHAIGLAIKALTMVNSTRWLEAAYGIGNQDSQNWPEDIPLSTFLEELFPTADHPGFGEKASTSYWDMRSSITCVKLMRRGRLSFQSTENLSNHLKLNRKTGVVEIFHHTAFLKESLRITKNQGGKPLSFADTIGRGAVPRQLAIEVLDSIQKIIFPLSDPSAVSVLRSLITEQGFDSDCLRFEASAIREPHEINTQYIYFGARLADIHDELEHPTPRGFLSRWAKRKSTGHANIATIIGVILALFFGIATLGLSVFQAWVGYQQWQHPIQTN